MRRHTLSPRQGWEATVESQGLVYATTDGSRYWDESVYYEFGLAEIERLEETVASLHEMCLTAVDHVIATNRYADFGITDPRVQRLIAESRPQPALYGRFDLRYDGEHVKLLEYNADTPTSLVEAATVQWFWMEERFPADDQWNSLHDRLVEAWRRYPLADTVHFVYTADDTSGEDHLTTAYLQETAAQAGRRTHLLPIEAVGWDPIGARFVDDLDRTIGTVFKLYPWEWLVADRFGAHVLRHRHGPVWIEPPWKLLLSNKALLAILWELFPGHPHLLPAYLDGPRELVSGYVAKPLLGREGAGVVINEPRGPGHCYQAFYPLPEFGGHRPVLGAWVVGDEPAGLGIRESAGLITDLSARFVPHVIRG